MITKLSPEQIARLPEYRNKWIAIGLSTEPANRPEAEEGICRIYASKRLPRPRIVWCGSPLSQGLTRAVVLNSPAIKDIRDSVWASVGDSVWDSVRDSGRDSVRDSGG